MSKSIQVLFVGTSGAIRERLAAALAKRVALSEVAAHDDLVAAVAARGPHVVIIVADDAGMRATRALKQAESPVPILMLGDDPAIAKSTMAVAAGADDALAADFSPAEIMGRVRALARLDVMYDELKRRTDIRRRYGIADDLLAAPVSPRGSTAILIAGDLRAEDASLKRAAGSSAYLAFAEDPVSAVAELASGDFDAAVVGVDAPDRWLLLCDDVRENARLYNLPLLMVADPDCFADPAEPFDHGATDVMLRPFAADELRNRLDLLVRQQRYRKRMRAAYHRALHVETSDSLTGLYNFGYLHEHLASLLVDVERWDRTLAVGFLDIAGMARLNQAHGYAGGDTVLRQLGGLVARLVRGEDLSARFSGEEFCVVMPGTTADEAGKALGRIASVVDQTAFGIPGCERPVHVRFKVGLAEAVSGDTPEALIERARAALA